MKKNLLWIVAALLLTAPVAAQDVVPTLVPPTPLPSMEEGISDALLSESALARIQQDGRLRVGTLFNESPFGELNIRGEVVGYDADLARAFAEAWGVELDLVQVTRQTGQDALISGEIDLLIAAQVHRRSLDAPVEYSHTYYQGSQVLLVLEGDGAVSVNEMLGRNIGFVMGTRSERALAEWQARSGQSANLRPYLTLDQAIGGLAAGEVDAVAERRVVLRDRVVPGTTRLLEGEVGPEPYAVAMRRQDVNLRNLVNRTMQFMAASGRIPEIYNAYFPSSPFPAGLIPEWQNVGDAAPQPSQFGTDVPYPQQYGLARVLAEGVLRVSGVPQVDENTPDAERRMADANRRLVENMASRWGVRAEFVSAEDPLAAVADGRADLAVGAELDWDRVNTVDFTGAYLLRGKRLLVEERSPYNNFNDLRGRWIGVFTVEQPEAEELVNELVASINTSVNIFPIGREQSATDVMLVANNIDVVFGDIVRLLPYLEQEEGLRLANRCDRCDPWYSREYVAFAVTRNDPDFRAMVEYTLQEMALDGTLEVAMTQVLAPDSRLTIDVWPGPTEFLGVRLG